MKVMKSLLLGAAAGLFATAGGTGGGPSRKGQAGRIREDLLGVRGGLLLHPRHRHRLRVGGYVYLETGVKGSAAVANIYNIGRIDANYNYNNWRTSARINLDARQNTAYGTLRAFMSTGGNFNLNHGNVTSWDAAYIQFAGFTWGYTNSFFSFSGPGYGIVASPMSDWKWINLAAYTAQFGNGVTATISVEEGLGRRAMINGAVGATGGITTGSNVYGGSWAPDVVGNINVTQAWGRAQIMGALHQVKANSTSGHDSEWGYAFGGAIEIKTPQTGNPNNSFLLHGVYSKGAVDYTGYRSSPTATPSAFTLQNFAGTGPMYAVNDATLNGTSLELTRAWSVYAAYRHYWTPALRTAFAYGYLDIEESATSTAQGDLAVHQANVSTVWSPVAGLDLSLDVVYSKLKQDYAGVTAKNDLWTVWHRVRRNF